MDTPGFDPTSITGMVAGGANIVVFSTGRGSLLWLPANTIAENLLQLRYISAPA